MPLQLPGQGGTPVGGPWGGTMYPEWFTAGIGPQLQAKGPEAIANLFADYVASRPNEDFGWYWNNFRPGGPQANNRFGGGQPGNPYGTEEAAGTPPPTNPPPPGTNPNGTGPDPGGNHTSRPTTPGGPEPGHWQRLISHRNGVRNERWEWRQDAPAAPAPPVTGGESPPIPDEPAPTTPPSDTGDGKPKPNPGGWQKPKPQGAPPFVPPGGPTPGGPATGAHNQNSSLTNPTPPTQNGGPQISNNSGSTGGTVNPQGGPVNPQPGSTPTNPLPGTVTPPIAPQPSSLVAGALSGNINQRRRPGFAGSGQSVDPNRFRNQ